MLRLACQTRLRCATRWAAALVLIAAIGAAPNISHGEESIGRFPAASIPAPPATLADETPPAAEPAATPTATAPPQRTAALPVRDLPPETVATPLLVEEQPPLRQTWPDQPPATVDELQTPAAHACPDCGGHYCRGGRCVLSHFSGWDPTGQYFTHNNPDDPARHVGKGEPLYGTSWRNRPIYTGVMLGGMLTNGPLDPIANYENGGLFSLYQGYDFDHFWGGEMRLAAGNWGLSQDPDHSSDVFYVDAHLSYYPWGDARFRPYVSGGIGFMGTDFVDEFGTEYNELLLTLPLSLGFKYQMQPHYALRFDFTQNLSFGDGGLDTMANFSLSAGIEWHYGGRRKSYFPWNGGVYGH